MNRTINFDLIDGKSIYIDYFVGFGFISSGEHTSSAAEAAELGENYSDTRSSVRRRFRVCSVSLFFQVSFLIQAKSISGLFFVFARYFHE